MDHRGPGEIIRELIVMCQFVHAWIYTWTIWIYMNLRMCLTKTIFHKTRDYDIHIWQTGMQNELTHIYIRCGPVYGSTIIQDIYALQKYCFYFRTRYMELNAVFLQCEHIFHVDRYMYLSILCLRLYWFHVSSLASRCRSVHRTISFSCFIEFFGVLSWIMVSLTCWLWVYTHEINEFSTVPLTLLLFFTQAFWRSIERIFNFRTTSTYIL
jgi:hypothetical protein